MKHQTFYTLTALSSKQLEILKYTFAASDFDIESTTLKKYTGTETKPTIPNIITKIARLAFACHDTLEEIILPEGITVIEAYAFLGCPALKKIQLPDTVRELHPKAFLEYDGIIYAPKVLQGCSAFDDHKVVYASIPDSTADDINDFVINGTVLVKYKGSAQSPVLPDGITSIGKFAFRGCKSLTSIVLPDGITSIGKCAFLDCTYLSSIVLPDGITSIGKGAFQNCTYLSSIVLPDGITSIDKFTFGFCFSLSSIVLPNSITSIGESAFLGCARLSSIVLPDGITSIGEYAFLYCDSLTSLSLPSNVKKLAENAFDSYKGKIIAPIHLKNHAALCDHKVQYYNV